MLPLHIPDQQYIVSLDALDLSLLSHHVQRPANEKKVLWSKPIMDGESVYCEIQIPSDDENEDSFIEPSETYICYICNIEVPKLYYKQHNKCRQHHNYKKLTEKVLENVLKQMNIDIDYVDNPERHDKFYCETCSKVVLLKNKRQHKKSTLHLKCVEKQNLADIFIEPYVNVKKGSNVKAYKSALSEKDQSTAYNSGSDTDWNLESDSDDELATNSNKYVKINKVLPNLSLEATSNKPGLILSNVLESHEESAVEFELYLNEMIAKYHLKFNIPAMKGNSVVIVTPKGYVENISIDSFHSYKRIDNSTYCQLCKTSFDDRIRHSRSKEHVSLITQSVDDNFARGKIQPEGWSHCLICNVLMNPLIHPLYSPKHSKYNNENKPKENPVKNKSTVQKTFCDVCKISIDTHNFAVHLKASKHKNNVKLAANNPSKVPTGHNNTNTPNGVEENDSYCQICKVNVPPGGMTIHKAGRPHKSKCIDVNSSTNEVKTVLAMQNNALPSTSKSHILPHLNPKNVTTASKLMQCNKQMTVLDGNTVNCKVCDAKVPNLDDNIIEHVEGAKHTKAVGLLLSNNKMKQTGVHYYYCDLCKKNYIEDFIHHINEDYHHKVKYLEDGSIDKVELRKYIYQIPLTSDTLVYRNVYEKLLVKNKIVRLNSSSFYCSVCSINLSRTTEIDHMFGDRHKSLNV